MRKLVPSYIVNKFSKVYKPFAKYFSTSGAKRSSVWPGTYISIAAIAGYLVIGIGSITSLAAMGVFLSNGPTGGLEAEFIHVLEIFLRNMNNITYRMVNHLTHSYTQQDLQAFLDIFRGIIVILQQILELVNDVLEDIDTMSGLYDRAFDAAIQIQSFITRLLIVYRRIEAELGIPAQETDLVPDPSEADFYAAYVLALTGQGA